MKKIVLIDGNNLMFRSFYATSYTGNMMRNSKNFPTNALFGFISMINKIISEEKPTYMMVAFDIGKNFRKKEFDFYKEGRQATPDELKLQMPVARKILDAMGIKYCELEPYEADDIIGTFVKKIAEDKDFDATIISSDRDLLQLINFETDIKLLKQTGFIRYTEKSFEEQVGIKPIRVIDLKALMGDSSDNIPGVKGIGEKTALKLLNEYKTLDGIYENIDKIKGSVHDKLVMDKDNAYMSYKIATIYCDVPLEIDLEDTKYNGPDINKLKELYTDLEFYSFLKKIDTPIMQEDIKYINVNDDINIVLDNTISLYIDTSDDTYTSSDILSAVISDKKYNYYFDKEHIHLLSNILINKDVITYNNKKNLYFLDNNYKLKDDLLIGAYLLGLNVKDDISTLGLSFDIECVSTHDLLKNKDLDYKVNTVKKARMLYDLDQVINDKLINEDLIDIYRNIELPLSFVLSDMEKEGIKVDTSILDNQKVSITKEIEDISNRIYALAGEEFNISSVKQLGEILFEKLDIAKGKKNKTGYKTDASTLEKLSSEHEIIPLILRYRELSKLNSTYIEGLKPYVLSDGKIHTIFKQTVARTGRLSSTDPNLQNIPVKDELGRQIRKAFIPVNDMFLSCDYSQIELRIMAHVSNCQKMIDTFISGGDIHATVASDINGVSLTEVTKEMRSKAKSVIFGIIYGISGYGLMDNLNITKKEADYFINKYYEMYPEVLMYMNSQISFAKEYGYVKTMFNRKRVIDEVHNANFMIRGQGERMAINTPIQGAAADIIKMAMINVAKRLKEANLQSKMILQIHDELIFDVKKEELDTLIKIVQNEMENVYKLSVPLKVSTDTGINWYETK